MDQSNSPQRAAVSLGHKAIKKSFAKSDIKQDLTHMVTPFCIHFELHTNSKVLKSMRIDLGLVGSKIHAAICQ